mmetsp:Transcript_9135/g.31484  ORF Transcript_9135/g.31484 Transcript_9135/m.31484 type:complete len:322 (-) Transcript_9135:994-1959(-)
MPAVNDVAGALPDGPRCGGARKELLDVILFAVLKLKLQVLRVERKVLDVEGSVDLAADGYPPRHSVVVNCDLVRLLPCGGQGVHVQHAHGGQPQIVAAGHAGGVTLVFPFGQRVVGRAGPDALRLRGVPEPIGCLHDFPFGLGVRPRQVEVDEGLEAVVLVVHCYQSLEHRADVDSAGLARVAALAVEGLGLVVAVTSIGDAGGRSCLQAQRERCRRSKEDEGVASHLRRTKTGVVHDLILGASTTVTGQQDLSRGQPRFDPCPDPAPSVRSPTRRPTRPSSGVSRASRMCVKTAKTELGARGQKWKVAKEEFLTHYKKNC